MKVKFEGKVCGVCGDKALGFNFNAITCESCKAFFRRNALIQKDFKCPFSEHCSITPVTRRFCQKCRLDKCFAIGMCKNLIMSEEDKEMKRKKIIENRTRKRMGIGAFKKSFKKVRKNSNIFQQTADQSPEVLDDNDQVFLQTPNLLPPFQEDQNIDSIINEDFSLITSSDTQIVSSSDEVSMIRSILNNTPQKSQNINQIERNFDSTSKASILSENIVNDETTDNDDNSISNMKDIFSSDNTKNDLDDTQK